jgi:hypothetical protein
MAPSPSKRNRLSRYLPLLDELQECDGKGSIERVKFDVVHDRFDYKDWAAIAILQDFAYLPNESDEGLIYNRKQLWFPWYGKFDIRRLSDTIEKLSASSLKKRLNDILGSNESFEKRNAIARLKELYVPSVIVEAGDTVTISRVCDLVIGDEFLHEHDRINKAVYLSVIRHDGTEVKLETPYVIAGLRSILPLGQDTDNALGAVIFRIVQALGLKEPSQLDSVVPKEEKLRIAVELANKLFEITLPAWHDPDSKSTYSDDEVDYAEEALEIVNDAVVLGFLWGKIEADVAMRPLAESEQVRKKKSQEGGIKSAITRREKAKNNWMDEVRLLANEVRQKSPDISQERLALDLQAEWIGKNKLPGQTRLKQYIAELERSSFLPKRMPKIK